MMVSRFLRVLTSGLLLLLATDGAPVTSATICFTESTACQSDETCLSCLSAVSEDDEEVSECGAALGLDEFASSTWSCSDYMDVICCNNEVVSEDACLDNAVFEEYLLCALEENTGCMHDEITCSGASPSIGGAWTGVAFVGSTMALLPLLLWV